MLPARVDVLNVVISSISLDCSASIRTMTTTRIPVLVDRSQVQTGLATLLTMMLKALLCFPLPPEGRHFILMVSMRTTLTMSSVPALTLETPPMSAIPMKTQCRRLMRNRALSNPDQPIVWDLTFWWYFWHVKACIFVLICISGYTCEYTPHTNTLS